MTRDYKPAARNKKAPSSGSGGSMLVGILIGLLLGLGIALAVAIYLNKVPGAFLSRGNQPAEPTQAAKGAKSDPAASKSTPPAGKATEGAGKADAKSDEKPRFDFYSILPGTEDPGKAKPVPGPGDAAAEAKETFYLQAGAFQNPADAENMRARLALLGIEAVIQAGTSGDRGTFHRVRIGPFSRVDEVNRTRDTLKQNGIESTLIKSRDKAN